MSKAKVEIVIPPGKLWPNTPSGGPCAIEVFGATGEYKSGKTLLGLSIAPGCHPEGHVFAGKPRTLYLDFEKSGGCYGGTGCLRVDVPSKMLELQSGTYKPIDVFKWFLDLVENKLKPGQFDTIIADPITDIESGLVDFVKANCERFGLSKAQVEKTGGLLWGAVKDFWKQVLLKLGARCQCFFFTSHLRDVWAGNSPTGKREPKGKETLLELASLYLWLERKPDESGNVPGIPSAIVLKERLADTRMNAAGQLEIVQLVPPRLPVATVQAIRQYIANPPDYDKLKTGERVIEEKMTDETRLRLEAARAEADREAEVARNQRLDRMERLRAQQAAQQAKPQPGKATDKTAELQAAKDAARLAGAIEVTKLLAEDPVAVDTVASEMAVQMEAGKRLAAATPPENQEAGRGNPDAGAKPDVNGKATIAQVADIRNLCQAVGIRREELAEWLTKADAAKVSDLSFVDAISLIAYLKNTSNDGKCTIAQVADIKKLRAACNVSDELMGRMLAKVNAKKYSDLSYQHAAILIDKLEKASLKVQVDDVPY
jgi:hypothetical protein